MTGEQFAPTQQFAKKTVVKNWRQKLGQFFQSYFLLGFLFLPAVYVVADLPVALESIYFVLVSTFIWLGYARMFAVDASFWKSVRWVINKPLALVIFSAVPYLSYHLFWVVVQGLRYITTDSSLYVPRGFELIVSAALFLPLLAVYSVAIAEFVKKDNNVWYCMYSHLKLLSPAKYPLLLRHLLPSILVVVAGILLFAVVWLVAAFLLVINLEGLLSGKMYIGEFFEIFSVFGSALILTGLGFVVIVGITLPSMLFSLAYNGLRLHEKVECPIYD